jgi:hypothetical protein
VFLLNISLRAELTDSVDDLARSKGLHIRRTGATSVSDSVQQDAGEETIRASAQVGKFRPEGVDHPRHHRAEERDGGQESWM